MDHGLLARCLPSEGFYAFLDYLEAHLFRFSGGASIDFLLEQAQNFGSALLQPGLRIGDFRPVQADHRVRQFIGRPSIRHRGILWAEQSLKTNS